MIKIYTDGSCLGNPGKGGWAAIIFIDGEKIKIKGSKKNTTNNQMELFAPIQALKKIPDGKKIEIYTDSKYLKMGITEWIVSWKINGWKTSSRKKVKNIELWKKLDNLVKNHKIKWFWIKAHAGNSINEEVDLLAREAAILN
tara:strand:+ start:185 stop:610 length:426 start_codon:yes stop_codon:yes gene_type:complete